jgi:DNA-directed RNA polymerase subunit RPC12/RpoP
MKEAKCTNCGAGLKIREVAEIIQCSYCHSSIVMENSFDFAERAEGELIEIASLRENLDDYVKKNSIHQIIEISSTIKQSIPKDYLANYFFSYAMYFQGADIHLYSFFKSNLTHTNEELELVFKHLCHRAPIEERPQIISYLNKVLPHEVEQYKKHVSKRIEQESHYHNVPRDLYISFSKYDYNTAKELVLILESNGISCWMSRRNLRPTGENKRSLREDAMKLTSKVLVLKSENAIVSRDVQTDIELAIDLKKEFIEVQLGSQSNLQLPLLFKIALSNATKAGSFKNTIELIGNVKQSLEASQGKKTSKDLLHQEETQTDSGFSLKEMSQELLSLIQYILINNRTNNDVLEFMYYMTGVRKVSQLSSRQKKLFADIFKSLSQIYRQDLDYSKESFQQFRRYTKKRESNPSLLNKNQLVNLLNDLQHQINREE